MQKYPVTKKIKINAAIFLFIIAVFAVSVTLLFGCTKDNETYTVSFETGSGSTIESITFNSDNGYDYIPENPERDGYDFIGWYADEDFTQPFNFTDPINSDIVLYAKWNVASATIIFNGNGATDGSMERVRYEVGTTVFLPQNAYSREGYRFIGWGKTETDSVKNINGGRYYVTNEKEQVLYAKWSANSYLITLDKDGGINGNDYVQATYDSKLAVISKPSKAGYVFDGYYTEKNGEGVCYYDREGKSLTAWNLTTETVLYANWKSAKLKIFFDGNGAESGETESMDVLVGDAVKLNESNFIRTGYSFDGWSAERNGAAVSVVNGLFTVPLSDESLTLYCKWRPNKYSVEYFACDGSEQSKTQSAVYADVISIADNIFIRQGYAFVGWAKSLDAQVTFNGGEEVKNLSSEDNGIVRLYAVWQAREYQIVLNSVGGSGGTNKIKAIYDSVLGFAIAPHKTGYDFGGYYSQTEGKGICFYNGEMVAVEKFNIPDDVELFAKWLPKERKVAFDLNGGSGQAPKNIYTETGATVAIPDNEIFKTGYLLKGWCENKEGIGELFGLESYIVSASDDDIILYAIWNPKLITIIFDGNNGKGEMPKLTACVNDKVALPDCGFFLRGYSFVNWTNKDGNQFSDSLIIPETDDDVVLSANWEIINYKINYELFGGENDSCNPASYCVTDLIIELNAPTRKGYNFSKWTQGDKIIVSEIENLGDMTISAEWTIINYLIEYELNGADFNPNKVESYTVEDEIILQPAQRNGYTFLGWSGGGIIPRGSTGNVKIAAAWQGDVYKISYNLGGGINNSDNPDEYNYDSRFTFKSATRTGYNFIVWTNQDGDYVYELTEHSVGSITLTAQWEIINYEINYNLDGGINAENNPTTYTVEDKLNLSNPTKKGYWFIGWSDGGTIEYGSTGNKTFLAQWEVITYSVNYFEIARDENGELVLNRIAKELVLGLPERYSIEDVRNEPLSIGNPAYVPDGLEFICWTLDDEVFTKIPIDSCEDLYLVANWRYGIVYDLDGGDNNPLNPVYYTIDQEVILLNPTKNGYLFDYWQDELGNRIEIISNDSVGVLKLKAVWRKEIYVIYYELNGGENVSENPETYTIGTEIELFDPTRQGYVFLGWKNDDGNYVDKIDKNSFGDIYLSAEWEAIEYEIIYVLDDGINYSNAPQSYTIESNTIVLGQPEKAGYQFLGWQNENGIFVENIPQGSQGNIILTALWEKLSEE